MHISWIEYSSISSRIARPNHDSLVHPRAEVTKEVQAEVALAAEVTAAQEVESPLHPVVDVRSSSITFVPSIYSSPLL